LWAPYINGLNWRRTADAAELVMSWLFPWMVADRDCIVCNLVPFSDGRVKPGYDGVGALP
jgi:hypothetical protein